MRRTKCAGEILTEREACARLVEMHARTLGISRDDPDVPIPGESLSKHLRRLLVLEMLLALAEEIRTRS